MKHRSPIAVLLLPFITFGIYSLYWAVSTKGEMNKLGAKIPTAWLIIVPIVNIWWMWKYSEGVEYVTKEKMSGVLAFILWLLLYIIGQAIIQDAFNKVESSAAPDTVPPADSGAAPTDPDTPTTIPTGTPPVVQG